jgi:hypothetical protein
MYTKLTRAQLRCHQIFKGAGKLPFNYFIGTTAACS